MHTHKTLAVNVTDAAIGVTGGIVAINQWLEFADHVVAIIAGLITIAWFVYRWLSHKKP